MPCLLSGFRQWKTGRERAWGIYLLPQPSCNITCTYQRQKFLTNGHLYRWTLYASYTNRPVLTVTSYVCPIHLRIVMATHCCSSDTTRSHVCLLNPSHTFIYPFIKFSQVYPFEYIIYLLPRPSLTQHLSLFFSEKKLFLYFICILLLQHFLFLILDSKCLDDKVCFIHL